MKNTKSTLQQTAQKLRGSQIIDRSKTMKIKGGNSSDPPPFGLEG